MRLHKLILLPQRFLRIAWKVHPWGVTLLLALGLGVLFRAPLLQAAGGMLMVQEGPGTALTLCLRTGDGFSPDGDIDFARIPEVMRQAGLSRVILLEPRPRRLVRDGLQPTFAQLARQELERQGIAAGQVSTVDVGSRTFWEDARAVGGWLEEHPGEELVLLCEPFKTAAHRWILDQTLLPADARRVHVRSLPSRQFDVAYWWRSRLGVKTFMFSALGFLYGRLHGEDYQRPETWDPDAYEARLKASLPDAREAREPCS